jgi:hypothetical protein
MGRTSLLANYPRFQGRSYVLEMRDAQWFESMRLTLWARVRRKIGNSVELHSTASCSVRELKSRLGYGVFEFEARW